MTRPRFLTGTPKRLDSPQIRMSQTAAISSPPPTHAPWIIATTGCRQRATASIVVCTTRPYSRAWATSARSVSNSAMSAPAANAFSPAPRRITQRSDSSASRRAKISPSARHMPLSSAFSRSGLFSVTVAIAPSRATRTDSVSGVTALLEADVGVLHELRVFRELGLHERLELVGPRLAQLRAHLLEPRAHVGLLHRLVDVGVQLDDDLFWRPAGRHHPVPVRHVEAGHALLEEGRNFRKLCEALRRGDGERAEPPALDVIDHRRHGVEVHRHDAGEEIADRLAATLVRDVDDVDHGELLEHLAREMLGAARSG